MLHFSLEESIQSFGDSVHELTDTVQSLSKVVQAEEEELWWQNRLESDTDGSNSDFSIINDLDVIELSLSENETE